MTSAQLARMPEWYRKYADDLDELKLAPAVTWCMAADKCNSTANTVRAMGEKDTQRMLKVWKRLAAVGYTAVSEVLQ